MLVDVAFHISFIVPKDAGAVAVELWPAMDHSPAAQRVRFDSQAFCSFFSGQHHHVWLISNFPCSLFCAGYDDEEDPELLGMTANFRGIREITLGLQVDPVFFVISGARKQPPKRSGDLHLQGTTMPQHKNSAPTLTGAALYRQMQLANLPICRMTPEEHQRMLERYAQARVDFGPDYTSSPKRHVVQGRCSTTPSSMSTRQIATREESRCAY